MRGSEVVLTEVVRLTRIYKQVLSEGDLSYL